jgi:threonine dehydratase
MASNASRLGRNDLLAARERIAPYICHTPLTRSFLLSKATGREIWLKQENRQRTGSFKLRGAVNKIISLTAAERERGVVTASAGNHALGVAYACRALGVSKVDLFVQTTASTSKLSRLEEYAANVHLVGATFEDAQQAALQRVLETGAVYIPAYDDPAVIAGQGTCGLEITEDLKDFDGVVVPVGGGGLIAGIAIAVKSDNRRVRVFGVNPSASPSALLSLERGYAVDPYDSARCPFGSRRTLLMKWFWSRNKN